MSKKLEGKVAVVTGSGQGIGRGIAIGMAREGAKVVTNNRKPLDKKNIVLDPNLSEEENKKYLSMRGDAEGTAQQIKEEGGEAVPFFGNVADYDTAGQMIQKAINTYGRVDILVNNAAGLGTGMLTDTTEADWDYQTIPKMKGAYNCMHHAVPFMIEQKFGRVINISSMAFIGLPGLFAYSAANAGIVGLSKAAAKDLYPTGVTVNTICPQAASPGHFVEFKSMIKKLSNAGVTIDEERVRKVEEDHGPAENLAPFLAYLATEEAATISGAVFDITASGRITIWSDPAPIHTIKKDNHPWTMEELITAVPEELLKGYESNARVSGLS